MIAPLAPVTTALHKRGGHIIHNGCVPIDVEAMLATLGGVSSV